MSEREKRLTTVFGAVLMVGIGWKFVYPGVISPMFEYGSSVEAAEQELRELQAERDELQARLKADYDEYVLRTGGTDPSVVRDDMYDCINELLKASKLRSTKLNPKSTSIDKKTRIATLRISVSAKGRFAQCVGFIKRFYGIPYLARFSSLKLTPTPSRQQANHDEVKLDAEIEALVVPYEKLFGEPKGEQSAGKNVLVERDTRALETWKPFTRYREPVKRPDKPVVEKPPPPPPPEPEESGPPVSPTASETIMRMVLRYGVDEVMLENYSTGTTDYVAVGGVLDAGELVLVHALGAVAHKERAGEDFGYYVYPLGEFLDGAVRLEDAYGWPEIQAAMVRYFDQRRKRRRQQVETQSPEAWSSAMEVGQLSPVNAASAHDDDFVGPPFLPAEGVEAREAEDSPPAVEAPAPVPAGTNGVEPEESKPSQPAGEVVVKEKEAATRLLTKPKASAPKPISRRKGPPRADRKRDKSDAD